ncbi:MAG: hypothetical protein ACYS0D_13535 [Planctomycetota bacterium]|jgi:hypothetical protein
MGGPADFGTEDIQNDFWKRAVIAIRLRQEGQTLTWNQRAMLVTKLPSRLPDLCKRHGLGCPDGYVEALQRLATGKRMEFFDRDGIKKLVAVLDEVVGATDQFRANADAADYLALPTFGPVQR